MKRHYESQQGCPIARALDLVGDRWTILVLRDLHRGRNRFAELLRSLEGISPNLLSARLKALERAGLVERRLYSDHPPRSEYALTECGRDFGPVLQAMFDWGAAYRGDAVESRS
jgi:DNA-binding HxlR family transcriptional regulator